MTKNLGKESCTRNWDVTAGVEKWLNVCWAWLVTVTLIPWMVRVVASPNPQAFPWFRDDLLAFLLTISFSSFIRYHFSSTFRKSPLIYPNDFWTGESQTVWTDPLQRRPLLIGWVLSVWRNKELVQTAGHTQYTQNKLPLSLNTTAHWFCKQSPPNLLEKRVATGLDFRAPITKFQEPNVINHRNLLILLQL